MRDPGNCLWCPSSMQQNDSMAGNSSGAGGADKILQGVHT